MRSADLVQRPVVKLLTNTQQIVVTSVVMAAIKLTFPRGFNTETFLNTCMRKDDVLGDPSLKITSHDIYVAQVRITATYITDFEAFRFKIVFFLLSSQPLVSVRFISQ